MKTSLTEILTSNNPKEAFEGAKPLAQEAKDAVKKAHKSLVDVVIAIKGSVKMPRGTATTTPSTATTTATTTNQN